MYEEQWRTLERVKAVRRENCGVVTKLCREADGVLEEESFNTDPIKVSQLNVICEQLDDKLKYLSTLDGEIVSLCCMEEIEGEIEESEAVVAKIIEAKQKYKLP